MEQADRILFVASALLECPQTLKQRLRLCAELDRISVTVRRMERALDEHVGNAREDALMAHTQSEVTLMRPAKPARPKLRVVAGGAA